MPRSFLLLLVVLFGTSQQAAAGLFVCYYRVVTVLAESGLVWTTSPEWGLEMRSVQSRTETRPSKNSVEESDTSWRPFKSGLGSGLGAWVQQSCSLVILHFIWTLVLETKNCHFCCLTFDTSLSAELLGAKEGRCDGVRDRRWGLTDAYTLSASLVRGSRAERKTVSQKEKCWRRLSEFLFSFCCFSFQLPVTLRGEKRV